MRKFVTVRALGGLLATGLFAASIAAAATIETGSAFVGSNGAVPANGNLLLLGQSFYGATYGGGAADQGAVFVLPSSGNAGAQAIYSFSGPDGAHPNGSLVADAAGNLYGTTAAGGPHDDGTIFRLSKPTTQDGAWVLTTLHSFSGPDGAHPAVGVTFGPGGTALYGAAYEGGTVPCNAIQSFPDGCGTVFKLLSDGSFHLLHVFSGYPKDGAGPGTNLLVGSTGVVIGTTNEPTNSGDGGGLFAITAAGAFTNVSEFFPKALQGYPIGNIVTDAAGNVYGMSQLAGGIASPTQGSGIWEVTAGTHKQMLLAILPNEIAKSGVVRDGAGNLIGTTTGSLMDQGVHDAGSVFSVSPSGTLSTLAALPIANQAPIGGVILDQAGNLWGTSSAGGQICISAASPAAAGCGTVFKLTP